LRGNHDKRAENKARRKRVRKNLGRIGLTIIVAGGIGYGNHILNTADHRHQEVVRSYEPINDSIQLN
jgi:hypothetical protein